MRNFEFRRRVVGGVTLAALVLLLLTTVSCRGVVEDSTWRTWPPGTKLRDGRWQYRTKVTFLGESSLSEYDEREVQITFYDRDGRVLLADSTRVSCASPGVLVTWARLEDAEVTIFAGDKSNRVAYFGTTDTVDAVRSLGLREVIQLRYHYDSESHSFWREADKG